jgi:pimeloyl-ACP methyl ester carboxylesterase
MEDRWVDGERTRLSYVEWHASSDSAGPTFVLLHGMSSNALFWLRVARQMPTRRVVAIDLRGHGHSERPSAGYTAAVMAEDVARAITALRLGEVVLAGHSWGSAVGLELSARHPGLTKALVLVDGPTASLSQHMSYELADCQMRPPAPCYREISEAEIDQARFLGAAWGEDLHAFVHRSYLRSADCWRPVLPEPGRLQMVRDLYEFRPEDILPTLEVPVLVIAAADDSDGVAPAVTEWWRSQAEMAAGLCRAGSAKRYESRHDIPLIRPDALAQDLEHVAEQAGNPRDGSN